MNEQSFENAALVERLRSVAGAIPAARPELLAAAEVIERLEDATRDAIAQWGEALRLATEAGR